MDSYAATFIEVLNRFAEISSSSKKFLLAYKDKISLVVSAMLEVVDMPSNDISASEPYDYLSIAHPAYPVKYLMDNSVNFLGELLSKKSTKRLKKEKSCIKKGNFIFFFFLCTISFSSCTFVPFAMVRNIKMRKMKTLQLNRKTAGLYIAVLPFLAVLNSCDIFGPEPPEEKGELRIAFAREQESLTRAGLAIPDTSDFILTIKDSRGKVIYDGKYGDSQESISLASDSYTVSVISEEFSRPAFSSPQFGDEQCVVVPSGNTVNVRLVCRQINSGVRLKIDSGFLEEYPDGVLLLKSSLGRLVYGYSEKRTAYFKPGELSLVLNEGKTDKVLMTRELKAQEILELKIGVASSSASSSAGSGRGGMSVEIDTSRIWRSDVYIIGGENGDGSGMYDAMTVSEALSSVGEEDVWVSGYIVGGDLTASSASFIPPFDSRTNLLLGPRSSTDDKDACLSVNLPSGEIRESLNLVDNPALLGRKICLRGDIVEAYYGIPGLRNITEYELL